MTVGVVFEETTYPHRGQDCELVNNFTDSKRREMSSSEPGEVCIEDQRVAYCAGGSLEPAAHRDANRSVDEALTGASFLFSTILSVYVGPRFRILIAYGKVRDRWLHSGIPQSQMDDVFGGGKQRRSQLLIPLFRNCRIVKVEDLPALRNTRSS